MGRGPEAKIRWKAPFGAVVIIVVSCTVAAGFISAGDIPSRKSIVFPAVVGELLVAVALYLFLEIRVFRPAERWEAGLFSSGTSSIPSEAGILTPLASAVAAGCGRVRAELEEEINKKEEKLRRIEMLKSELEGTRTSLQARIQEMRTIHEASTAIAGSLDIDEIFRILPERVMKTLGLKDFCILMHDADNGMLVCRAGSGESFGLAGEFRIAPGEGVSGRVFESGEPVYIPDVRTSPEFRYYDGKRLDVRSFMSVPLLSRGKTIGVLNVNHSEPGAFDAESLSTMRVLASYLAIAIENANLFRFVKTLAEKDSLTMLYNHGAFHEKLAIELERADRYGRPLSVLMMDLDDFKRINDVHGHIMGDRILLMTAGVLCAHLRKSDIPSRYGGDEFAIILPETDLGAASSIATRIGAGITGVRMDTGKGDEITFTASIGYASCLPDSRDRENILNVADRLMYESKRRGRGGVLGEQL